MATEPASLERPSAPAARAPARRQPPRPVMLALVPPNWWLIAPIIVALVVFTMLATGTLPGLIPSGLFAVSMGLAALTGVINRREASRPSSALEREAVHSLAVGGPCMLFGLAMALWTDWHPAVFWQQTIGPVAILSALAVIILNQRVHSIIGAQVAIWLGVALVSGNMTTLLILCAGAVAGAIAAVRQIYTDKAAADIERDRLRAQQRAEELLNEFEESGQGWFFETDRRGYIVYVSPTVAGILDCRPRDLVGKPFAVLFASDAEEGERSLAFHLNARSAFNELALRAATRAEERWWSITGRPLYDDFGNFLGFRGSGHDLTEKRRSQQHASRLAHFDSLTGLANRLQMAQTLERILVAPNPNHRSCSIFLLDLDRFKQVNDTMGHPAGDALLTQVAERLKNTVGEAGRVGRLGGDEFEVIIPGRHSREDLAILAKRIITNLSMPYQLEGHRVVIGASLGIALAPDDGVTSEALIRNADLALYAAKDGGRGRHHFYAPDLHSDAEERRQLEHDLRDALSNGGLQLVYQPVVHTSTERITGFEALLRWNHPVHGWLSPGKFIPVAEDAGLITQIGEWALRTACADLANWPETVRVAVNVSPLQFASPSLPAVITNALASAQVSPGRLELEITESVFLNEGEGTDAMFAALKRVGVRLALDDFGTGYSSLGYLRKAPFDKIKIDQSFVRGATQQGSRNGAIISSIVSLAEALGMETTAEGVETLDELDLVRVLGCSHVQGYIYDKPLSRDEATQRLSSGLTAIAIGPRAARAARNTMLRKVVLEHNGERYPATIRNISATGAMIEGLWNVPSGTIFKVMLTDMHGLTATARWCREDRMGVEFATPLRLDSAGKIILPGQTDGQLITLRRAVGQ